MVRVCEENLDDLAAIEYVSSERSMGGEGSEAVIGDQAESSTLAKSFDPVAEEHRV